MLQDLRKEAGYNVDDRIYIFIETQDAIRKAVTVHADYILKETLAIELQDHGQFEWDKEKIFDLEGTKVKVAVRR